MQFNMLLVALGGVVGRNISTCGLPYETLGGINTKNVKLIKMLLKHVLCSLDTLHNHLSFDFIL